MRRSMILLFVIGALCADAGRARSQDITPCRPIAVASERLVAPRPGCPIVPAPPAPLLEAPCARRTVLSVPPGGAGVLFDATCARAYVLPPATGNVSAAQLIPTENVHHCPAVLRMHVHAEKSLAQVTALQAQIEAQLARFDATRREVEALQGSVDAAIIARAQVAAELAVATDTLALLTADLANADVDYDNCLVLASAPECANQGALRASAAAALASYTQATYDPLSSRADAANAAYARAFHAFTAKLEELATLLTPALALSEQIAETQRAIEAAYAEYEKLEGARGILRYSVAWEALRAAYRLANPAVRLSYVALPIQAASLSASTLIGGEPTNLTALLWVKSPADLQGAGAAGMELLRGGGSLPIEIGLSLLGACPFFADGRADVAPKDIETAALAAYVVANLAYRYQAYASDAYAKSIADSALTAKLATRAGRAQPRVTAALDDLLQSTARAQAYKADTLALTGRHEQVVVQQAAVRKASADVMSAGLKDRAGLMLPTSKASADVMSAGLKDRAGLMLPTSVATAKPSLLRPHVALPLESGPSLPASRPEKTLPQPIIPPKQPPYRAIVQTGMLTFLP
jgi:hypothetical protein